MVFFLVFFNIFQETLWNTDLITKTQNFRSKIDILLLLKTYLLMIYTCFFFFYFSFHFCFFSIFSRFKLLLFYADTIVARLAIRIIKTVSKEKSNPNVSGGCLSYPFCWKTDKSVNSITKKFKIMLLKKCHKN